MVRTLALAFGLVGVVSLLTAPGCSSNTGGGAVDAGTDACPRGGCALSCAGNGPTTTVTTIVDGCVVEHCCVPIDAGSALCEAAGGQCVFGDCSNPGPQNCGSLGTFCCLNSVPAGDAGADAASDAGTDACAPTGCTGSCLTGRHNVSHLVDGCLVWECCVPDDAGAEGGPLDASGE